MSTEIEALIAERDALLAQNELLHSFIESVMANIGAGATLDEVADMLCDWWDTRKTPQQFLRDVQAEAGRAGYLQGHSDASDICNEWSKKHSEKHADEYAATVRQGGE